ncbi:DNA transformation protein [Sphingomonas naasensis]|uniref:TfoX family protein n=1 Tax=Sphingomonas naasensis TaxID=1344951 RepID=A0A4S1WER7_9SPHN|nr:TfoX/Sxy family protein [Sphingomonas naasensis]NIJ19752.1 DNA transformation protein [Sphingomonas naasensis]TGX40107.1 TfoX family protein [Sphingomonas naasensis]
MAVDEGLVAWVTEALEPVGSVTMRRMMGGATLYIDGTIFGIVHDGELWFKADAESNALWDEAGHRERFTVMFSTGMSDTMNYRRAPSDVYDDADAMREWAAHAIAAGMRAPKKKPKKR